MKTLTSLLFCLSFIVVTHQASALSLSDKGKNPFSKKIQSALSTPNCMKDKAAAEKITVCFVVNELGDVTEAFAKTENPELKAQLQKQFMSMNLKGMAPCVTHSIDVNFVIR